MTGGFVLGEVLALYHLAAAYLVTVGILLGMLWLCEKKGKSRLYLLLPLCFFIGTLRMQTEIQSIAVRQGLPLDQRYVQAQGHIKKIEEKENSCALTIEPAQISFKGEEWQLPRLLVYVKQAPSGDALPTDNLHIGNSIRVFGSLADFPAARNPGQFDSRMYYLSLGLEYCMYAEDMEITANTVSHYRESLRHFCQYCKDILQKVAGPEELGILEAALLGDKGEMDVTIKDLYQKNGISHLLAISGLHVSILGLGLYHILRRCGAGYGTSGIICAGLLVSYGILTGESPSVARAVIMLLCQCLAQYLGRTYDLITAACLAAFLLMFQFPYRLFQGGVQLSFGAVLGIGVLGRYLSDSLDSKGKLQEALIYGLAIQLVTYPLTLYHFFQYPIYGIVLNLIVIPFMAYVIYSGLLGILLGSFSLLLGMAAVGSAHYILIGYQLLCRFFEKLPGYSLILGRPQWWQLASYTCILCAGSIFLKMLKSPWKKYLCLFLITVCCFFILYPVPSQGFETTFLDVGQGDGIVLRTKDAVVLVDGGSTSVKDLGKYRLEPYLKSQGISRIDYAIVSHGDQDHISGLLYLLEEDTGIKLSHLLLPILGKEDDAYEPLKKAARIKGIKIYEISANDRIDLGKLKLECLYPGKHDTATDRNNQSSLILASYGEFSMLLTGDMDSTGEEKMLQTNKNRIPPSGISVLKAGHHGSRTSTGQDLLDALHPRWAVLSYEQGNSYGHPHREVIERLHAAHSILWQTAQSGAITLTTDGTHITWHPYIP